MRRAGKTWPLLLCLLLATGTDAWSQGKVSGAVSGKLTDLRSKPLAQAVIFLREAGSGKLVLTTKTRTNGTYILTGLAPGAYILEASNASGETGSVDGVFVTAGHEAHIFTALAMTKPEIPTNAKLVAEVRHTPIVALRSPVLRGDAAVSTGVADPVGVSSSSGPQVGIALAPMQELLTAARPVAPPAVPAPLTRQPELPLSIANSVVKTLRSEPQGFLMIRMAITAAQAGVAFSPHGFIAEEATASESWVSIAGDELQAAPHAGDPWQPVVFDAPPRSASSKDEEADGPLRRHSRQLSDATASGADHANDTRDRGAEETRLADPDIAIDEVRVANGIAPAEEATASAVHVQTRSGTPGWHGQAFVFERQNPLSARNPSTAWVQETSPGTVTTVPAFTPIPFSPSDHQTRWGVGAGSALRHGRLAWFSAVDGLLRNNPAVSTVRHPDQFFAQPGNDAMQLLSAQLDMGSANPIGEGVGSYSKLLEQLATLMGPAPRSSHQWTSFGRLDWKAGERHSFSLEGTNTNSSANGGGLARAEEHFGTHSLGDVRAGQIWLLGRWQAFLTPNLLAVTQMSAGRYVQRYPSETPSSFEKEFLANAWGRLPQITIDGRYGFTIGNPARFGPGYAPDERVYEAQQSFEWVRGSLLVKAGGDLRHDSDATTLLRNHTGSYHYASLPDFASDALVFAKYGLAGALDPMHQHNCDPRGKAWRDGTGQLHGLGYLPCFSYYTQTLGPTEWRVSSNNWAAYSTAQWQPAKTIVVSLGLRWDRQEPPPPIALVDNPDLPLTQQGLRLGDFISPRAGLAWGARESRWPVLRVGYGMFAGRTNNAVLQSVLTRTGSPKGDVKLFMRPTDNLQSQGGGAPPFPYVLSGMPGKLQKPEAVEFSPAFRNPQIHQAQVGIEQQLPGRTLLSITASASLARRLPVTMDTNYDPGAGPSSITYNIVDGTGKGPIKSQQITVPFFASWPGGSSVSGRMNPNYQQTVEVFSRANSTYESATARLSRNGRHGLTFNARYTYAHAMDWNPNEGVQITESSVLDPNDFDSEYGTSDLDVRHSAWTMLAWRAPRQRRHAIGWLASGWMLSGTAQFHSGLPYTMRTEGAIPKEFTTSNYVIIGLGPGLNGYGGDNRLYTVGRNTFRYPHTWKADMRLGRRFHLGHEREMELLAQSFNLFNHQNVTRIETTGYWIDQGTASGAFPSLHFMSGLQPGSSEFGQPLDVNAEDSYRERQFDLGLRVRF